MTRTKSVPFSIAWAVIAVLVGLNTHAVVGNIVLLSAAEQNVQTSGGGEVEGILVEDGTLKPVQDIQVLACPASTRTDGSISLSITLKYASNTDSQGRFHIKNLPPGTYGLVGPFLQPLRTADSKGDVYVVIKKDREIFDLGRIVVKKK